MHKRKIMDKGNQRVPMREKIGYSLGDASANLVFQIMMMFQLLFYTDVLGLKATTAGMVLLIARVFDAFVDPMVGILSDRTNTKWGKYRPWVLWTAIPFALCFVMAFYKPDLTEWGKIVYACVTYTLLMTLYSFSNTPYASLGGVMSSDSQERTQIASIRFIAATVATFVVQGLTLPLVAKLGNGDDAKGWFYTTFIFAIVGVIFLVITFLSTKERVLPPKGQENSIRQDFKDVLGCVSWRAMFFLVLFLFTTLALSSSSMSYFFNYYVDKESLFAFLSNFGLVENEINQGFFYTLLDTFGLIALPDLSNVFAVGFSLYNMIGQLVTLLGVIFLSGFLSKIWGKKIVFMICMALTVLVTIALFFVPPTDVETIFLINIVRAVVYSPTIPLLWAMMGDVADHSEWINKRRATGFVFAGVIFALKSGLGLGGAICGLLLGSFGFIPNAIQAETAILGIKLTASLVPALFYLFCVVSLFFYPITKQLNAQIQCDLEERRRLRF